jgi:hypothetical protein
LASRASIIYLSPQLFASCILINHEDHCGRTARDTIDSTIVTLCVALDRSSTFGEGLFIGNEATLQRPLFAPNAPHRAYFAYLGVPDHPW